MMKDSNSQQFIKQPKHMRHEIDSKNNMIIYNNITAKEQFIYACIKYFDGPNGCFPSLKKIADLSGASIPTVQKCIKILTDNGYIETERRGKFLYYKFLQDASNFIQIPTDFIKRQDLNLSFTEKAYLISLRQFLFVSDNLGKTNYTDAEIADKTGLARSTVTTINEKLVKKKYLNISHYQDPKTGEVKKYKEFQLKDLCLALCNKVKELDDRVEKIEENNTVRDNAYKRSILELARVLAETHGEEVYENIKQNLDKIIDDRDNVIKF